MILAKYYLLHFAKKNESQFYELLSPFVLEGSRRLIRVELTSPCSAEWHSWRKMCISCAYASGRPRYWNVPADNTHRRIRLEKPGKCKKNHDIMWRYILKLASSNSTLATILRLWNMTTCLRTQYLPFSISFIGIKVYMCIGVWQVHFCSMITPCTKNQSAALKV